MAAQTTTPSPQRAVRALWAVGWFSTGRSARGPRATRLKRNGYDGSKPQPPTWRGVGAEEPRPTAWGGARSELAAQTTAPSPQRAVRAPWAVGWFSTWRSARGLRATELERDGYGVSKPQPPTWRSVGEEEPRPTVWGGARRALAAKTTTPSPQGAVRAPWAVGWFSTWRSARGPRATELERDGTTLRSRSRRPGAVSVKKSLGQRRGVAATGRAKTRRVSLCLSTVHRAGTHK